MSITIIKTNIGTVNRGAHTGAVNPATYTGRSPCFAAYDSRNPDWIVAFWRKHHAEAFAEFLATTDGQGCLDDSTDWLRAAPKSFTEYKGNPVAGICTAYELELSEDNPLHASLSERCPVTTEMMERDLSVINDHYAKRSHHQDRMRDFRALTHDDRPEDVPMSEGNAAYLPMD